MPPLIIRRVKQSLRSRNDIREWCREEGLQPLPASAFNVALEDKGCMQTKSGNVRYWQGLKLEDALERDFRYAQGM